MEEYMLFIITFMSVLLVIIVPNMDMLVYSMLVHSFFNVLKLSVSFAVGMLN